MKKSLIMFMLHINFLHSQMPHTFETERFKAEKATDVHAPYIAQITSNEQIQEVYMTCDQKDFTNVSKQLSIINKQWDEYDYGLYIIFDKNSSEFVGFAGFHSVAIDENNSISFSCVTPSAQEVEIYYFFMPHHWGKGYGFEIASALISLAFEQLSCTSIIAYIEPKNDASLSLIKKLNFREEKSVMYNYRNHILYRLNKK